MLRAIAVAVTSLLAASAASAGDPIEGGGWRGSWQSDTSGHSGPMRATVRKLSATEYRVWFAGRFAGVVPFAYPARLSVTGATPEGVMLAGSQNLGPGLGQFRTTAVASPTLLDARFTAKRDRGRFVLTRGH